MYYFHDVMEKCIMSVQGNPSVQEKCIPRKMNTKTLIIKKHFSAGLVIKMTTLLHRGPKPSFQMKLNFAFHLEISGVEKHRIQVTLAPFKRFHGDDLGSRFIFLVLVYCVSSGLKSQLKYFYFINLFLLLLYNI